MPSLRIGTRGSPLALWQAHHVSDLLRNAVPGLAIELVEIQTEGDQVRDVPLTVLGGQGIFTKAIQDALLDRRVDVAVHSLKDLPTVPVPGLVLASVPARGPTGDVLVSPRFHRFDDLPAGARIATGSQRRRAQILHRRPDLTLLEMRGNVETRLRKMTELGLDGIILAEAGLVRLGLAELIAEVLDPTWMLPAVGQGALGLECRQDDESTQALLKLLDDPAAHDAVLAERAFLRGLGGGCQVPIACLTRIVGSQITLLGAVLSPDGNRRIADQVQGTGDQAEALGEHLAKMVLGEGAAELLPTQSSPHAPREEGRSPK